MHPNDLIEFRDQVAIPRMLQLFEKTQIPEGACYIDQLEFSSLDGRNCGFDSRIQASGLTYRAGKAEKYIYDACDVTPQDFFAQHKDCVFISDGSLLIEDELEELSLSTRIRNIGSCDRFFHWFESPAGLATELVSIEYEKLRYLLSGSLTASQSQPTHADKDKMLAYMINTYIDAVYGTTGDYDMVKNDIMTATGMNEQYFDSIRDELDLPAAPAEKPSLEEQIRSANARCAESSSGRGQNMDFEIF